MEARAKRQIIWLSVLLHVLFLLFWDSFIKLDIFPAFFESAPVAATSTPLVFDLQQPDLPREVIATPADAKTIDRPKKADFLSDKNALARNQETDPAVRMGENPYSKGDFISHDLPPRPASPVQEPVAAPAKEKPAANDKSPVESSQESQTVDMTETTRPPDAKQNNPGKIPFQLPLPGVPHDQQDSQVADSGGLSFNTYNWDFAPYMLELKERISRNIFPPLAFSQLGMIDGDTLLRFKIYPSGELRDLELLGYQGHRSLMETSTMAIKVSAPFKKLPNDFPEPFLEVTARFSFFIKNKRG